MWQSATPRNNNAQLASGPHGRMRHADGAPPVASPKQQAAFLPSFAGRATSAMKLTELPRVVGLQAGSTCLPVGLWEVRGFSAQLDFKPSLVLGIKMESREFGAEQ